MTVAANVYRDQEQKNHKQVNKTPNIWIKASKTKVNKPKKAKKKSGKEKNIKNKTFAV